MKSFFSKFLNIELLLTTFIRFGSMAIGIFLIRFFSGRNALDSWGSITMILAYSSVIMLFTQFGQGINMLKRLRVSSSHLRLVQFNSLVISVIPILIGLVLKNSVSIELYAALMMAPIFVWYRNFSHYFQRKENNKILFSLLNQESYIYYFLLLMVGVLYATNVPIDDYFLYASIFLVLFPVLYYLLNLRRTISEASIKRSELNLKISLPFFLASGSFVLLSWTDTIMLGVFKGDEVVGIYNGIFKISSLVTISLSLLSSFVAPRIRVAFVKGGKNLKDLVKPYNRMGLFLSLVSYTVIIVFSPWVFDVMKLPYSDGLYHSLLVLAFGYVVNASVGNVGFLLQLTNNQLLYNKIVFVALILNIILNYSLIPDLGIMGAAIASTITMSFWNILSYFAVRIKLGFSPI